MAIDWSLRRGRPVSRSLKLFTVAVLGLGTSLVGLQAQAAVDPLPPSDRIELYELDSPLGTGQSLREQGFDVVQQEIKDGKEHVELTAAQEDLAGLRKLGLKPEPVRNPQGQTQLQAARAQAANGYTVYKSYSERGGIADQLKAIANANKDIVKLTSLGKTLRGQDILAVKVSKQARVLPDGLKPAALYSATQHAREWIATEVDMRLLKHCASTNYRQRRSGTKLRQHDRALVRARSPTPTATTSPSPRATACGARTCVTSTATAGSPPATASTPTATSRRKFHYDEEGSSSIPSSETYRGTGPASEPETQGAWTGCCERVNFETQLNYHSFGPLLLYPAGYQIADTETADNPIYEALAGTDAQPAVPGFRPRPRRRALHHQRRHQPTTRTASTAPCRWTPRARTRAPMRRLSRLRLPRRRGAGAGGVREEPAVRAGRSPSPRSTRWSRSRHLGNKTPDFVIDPFERQPRQGPGRPGQRQAQARPRRCSTTRSATAEEDRDHQGVAGRRALRRRLRPLLPLDARGKITGTKPGDTVKVWFTAARQRKSAEFTYKVATDIGGKVLVLAAEDVTGISPAQGVHRGQVRRRVRGGAHPGPVHLRRVRRRQARAVRLRIRWACSATTRR